MTGQAQILAAARAGVALALPGAADRSEDFEGAPAADLPAFAVRIAPGGAVPAGMGAAGVEVTAQLLVSCWDRDGPGLAARLSASGADIDRRIASRGAPMAALLHWIFREGETFEVERGERRVGRMDFTFDLFWIAAAPADP